MNEESTYYHLVALKRGDIKSFEYIYTQHHSLIFHYSLKFIQDKALTEEATADVFITLWKKRVLINPNLPIQALLYKIAKDTAYNYLKKIASNTRLKQQYLENYPSIELKNGEVLFLQKEQLALFHQVIETLPPKRLKVFKMRYYEGMDNKKIAQKLGISINTVKVHLNKAKLYLKEKISKDQQPDWVLVWMVYGLFF